MNDSDKYIIEGTKIGSLFLSSLDEFLAQNWSKLECNDICDLYFQFCRDLKETRGTSTYFTGLSELIVFRFLVHQLSYQLGGTFKRRKINTEIADFINGNFVIKQSCKLEDIKSKPDIRPDITIWKSDKLICAIEIKAYLSLGFKTIQSEMNKFKRIQDAFGYDFGKLILIFNKVSKPKELGQEQYKDYPVVYLQGTQQTQRLFYDVLQSYLPVLSQLER